MGTKKHPAEFPAKCWGASMNGYGLYSRKPLRMTRHIDYGFRVGEPPIVYEYWARDGNLSINMLGLDIHEGGSVITFASEDKTKVEKFIRDAERVHKEVLASLAVKPLSSPGRKAVSVILSGCWNGDGGLSVHKKTKSRQKT